MKIKVIKLEKLLIDESGCLNQLHDLASEGYVLTNITLGRMILKQGEQKERYYYVDYNPISDEYLEFLKGLEYHYLNTWGNISFFYSDNKISPINSDTMTRYLVLKKKFSILNSLMLAALSLLLLSLGTELFKVLFHHLTLGAFIINFETYLMSSIIFLGSLVLLVNQFRKLLLRYDLKQYSKSQVTRWTKSIIPFVFWLYRGVTMMLVICLILAAIMLTIIFPGYSLLVLLSSILIIQIHKRTTKRPMLKWFNVVTLLICALSLFHVLEKPLAKSSFQSAAKVTTEQHKGVFVTVKSNCGYENDEFEANETFIEDLYEYHFDIMSDAIFKEVIVQTEQCTRYYSNEEINAMEEFNSLDIPYLSYEDAVKKFSKYLYAQVQVYCLDNWVVAKDDNKVLMAKVSDKALIDKVLDHYFG